MYGENAGFNLAHRGWKRDTLRCCELLSVSNVAGKHNLWAEKWRISRNFGEFHVERQSYGGGGVYRGWTINEFAFSNGHCCLSSR